MRFQEVRIEIQLSVFEEIAPQRDSLGLYIVILHFKFTVAQEISEKIRLSELSHILEISIVEFEICWVLIK